jgi:hypothetical protein
MNDAHSRCARTQDASGSDWTVTAPRGRRLSTSLALALATAAIAVLGAIPVAQAATGGASGFEPPAPAPTTPAPTETAATAEAGGELAFGPTRWAGASWYGPGLWGRSTACGELLEPTTIGVAHKTLPCGTTVRFTYHGRTVIAPVIDRGPYIKGRAWDLTAAAAEAIGLESAGVGKVRYQVATTYARR